MMNMKTLERLPALTALVLVVLIVAACAIRLRGDEGQTYTLASDDLTSGSSATKLGECRSVTPEQKEKLSECRKVWAEQRRHFLEQKTRSTPLGKGAAQDGSSLFVSPKDGSRLSPTSPSVLQPEKD